MFQLEWFRADVASKRKSLGMKLLLMDLQRFWFDERQIAVFAAVVFSCSWMSLEMSI